MAQVGACLDAKSRAAAAGRPPIRAIAVNDCYRLVPWADVCYFADERWWGWHKDRDEFKAFAGQKVSIEQSGGLITDPDVLMLHNYGTTGLSQKPNGLMTGQNSAHQALNLATLAGAKRIILLGFDMKLGPKNEEHWFGSHPRKTDPGTFSFMLNNFRKAVKPLAELGIEVINCSPDSALDCFRKEPLGETLARLEHDPRPAALPA